MTTKRTTTKLTVTKLEDRINPSGFADAGTSDPDDGYIDPGEVEKHSAAYESSEAPASNNDGYVDPGEVERHDTAASSSAPPDNGDGYVDPWEVERH